MDIEIVAEKMARLEELEQERQRLDARFEELDAQERVLRESVDKHDEQLAELERHDETIDGQLTELERRYQGLLDQRAALEEQWNALEESFTAFENQRNDLEAERKSCDAQRTSTRDDMARIEAQTVELQALSEELVARRDALDAEYTRLYAFLNEVAEEPSPEETASTSPEEPAASPASSAPAAQIQAPPATSATEERSIVKPLSALIAAAREIPANLGSVDLGSTESDTPIRPSPPVVDAPVAVATAPVDPVQESWFEDAPPVAEPIVPATNSGPEVAAATALDPSAATPASGSILDATAPLMLAAKTSPAAAGEISVDLDAPQPEIERPHANIIAAFMKRGPRSSSAAGSIVVNVPLSQHAALADDEDFEGPPKSRGWMWAGLGAVPVVVWAALMLGSSASEAPAANPRDVARAAVAAPEEDREVVVMPPVPPPPVKQDSEGAAETTPDREAAAAKKAKRRAAAAKRKRAAKAKERKAAGK